MSTVSKVFQYTGALLMAVMMTVATSDELDVNNTPNIKESVSTVPTSNEGRRWRIGYYEGGEYIKYQQVLMATVKGLMNLGWIKPLDIPEQEGEQTQQLWQWLATEVKSDYVEFVSDAYFSINWDDEKRDGIAAAAVKRLGETRDLDLMIAMGTWAGKDLANNRHHTPLMVLSTSDPISAGIIKSVDDSGYRHVHAMVDPYRYERQIRVFHDSVGFKKLGVAYENTVNGRSYAALETLLEVGKQLDFSVEHCHTQSDISDTKLAEQSVVDCFTKLGKSVDAIYVTEQGGVTQRSLPELVRISNQFHIPTFSQAGSEQVKYGFLASLSQAGYRYIGEFHATTFSKVFNGANPNDLDQLYEARPKMAINMKTAEIIGFDMPLLLLGAADEIYRDIAQTK